LKNGENYYYNSCKDIAADEHFVVWSMDIMAVKQ